MSALDFLSGQLIPTQDSFSYHFKQRCSGFALYNPRMPEWVGKTVGKVLIEKHLAQGGMAEVYLGTHLTLDRPVAIKVMHNFIEADEDQKARFQREARVVASLRHPNIVQIYDFDTADGHPYIVMEYLKGPTLATYLRNSHERGERMQPAQIARLLSKLATALDYAHERGVIHRDIKPGNILLDPKSATDLTVTAIDDAEPVLTDFGLVRIANATMQSASGLVSGTPAYISPEQAQGLKVDHRSDIYSLGVVLYEILAGKVPFEAETTWSMIYKQIHEPPPPIPDARPAIQKVIDRALAKNPDDRHQSCRELAVDYLNAIGLIAEAATLSFSLPPSGMVPPTPPPDIVSQKNIQASAPTRRNIYPLIGAGILVLGLAAFGVTKLFSSPAANTPRDANDSIGLLRFQDGTAPADKVTFTTASMPLPPEGSQYEAWLLEDDNEQRIPLGVIEFDPDKKGSLTFVDSQGRNLLGIYHRLEITIEPDPDNNTNPSNDVAFTATLPATGLIHVRHLLFSFGATPDQIGFIRGLDTDTKLVNDLAQQMLEAFEAGNEAEVPTQAEAMLNVIVGNRSEDHKDWNNDGTVADPGDGYGLLFNGENLGYVQGTYTHADLSITSADATQNMLVHGGHVKIAATNVGNWSAQLREQLIAIVSSPSNAETEGLIRDAVALANQMQNGIDINGNENIEPIEGEGGARTAYEHAYYMADILIPAP